MSLRTADSLSNGFENPLESHLHGVDGFFREHTALPAPEIITLQGGIEGYRTKAGIMTRFTYQNTRFIFR